MQLLIYDMTKHTLDARLNENVNTKTVVIGPIFM